MFSADSVWTRAVVAAVTGIFGMLLCPVLVAGAAAIGWLAVAALALGFRVSEGDQERRHDKT